MTVAIVIFCVLFTNREFVSGYRQHNNDNKLTEIFSWKQIGYDFNGVLYTNSTDFQYKRDAVHFHEELNDSEKFFIQQNNVPIGFEVYKRKVFVTVPRRRHGIPSTLNYLDLGSSGLLKPYPDVGSVNQFVSVYRPRVDECDRLWMVDTGLLEVPGARKQVQPPAVIIFDLKTNKMVVRQELDSSVIVNERTPGGLTSIAVEVDPDSCEDAFAYINDLATEGLVVFSLKDRTSWRVDHPSFKHDVAAMNFTSSGHVINWSDGLFGMALVSNDCKGNTLYYHPLVSTQEFAVDTTLLKTRASLDNFNPLVGNRGPNTQSGSADFHSHSGSLFFANVAQGAILCWNVNTELTPSNVAIVAQDSNKLGYISDLKVRDGDVWLLANQIPKFVYNTQNVNEYNYFIMRGKVRHLIRGTKCESR